ncbi:UNVERIFIED_CONTAM: hypothetical protein NCL1_03749 [Trichonephila clavipes]
MGTLAGTAARAPAPPGGAKAPCPGGFATTGNPLSSGIVDSRNSVRKCRNTRQDPIKGHSYEKVVRALPAGHLARPGHGLRSRRGQGLHAPRQSRSGRQARPDRGPRVLLVRLRPLLQPRAACRGLAEDQACRRQLRAHAGGPERGLGIQCARLLRGRDARSGGEDPRPAVRGHPRRQAASARPEEPGEVLQPLRHQREGFQRPLQLVPDRGPGRAFTHPRHPLPALRRPGHRGQRQVPGAGRRRPHHPGRQRADRERTRRRPLIPDGGARQRTGRRPLLTPPARHPCRAARPWRPA